MTETQRTGSWLRKVMNVRAIGLVRLVSRSMLSHSINSIIFSSENLVRDLDEKKISVR